MGIELPILIMALCSGFLSYGESAWSVLTNGTNAMPVFSLARHLQSGLSHTEGIGLSHTATLGVTQTALEVTKAPPNGRVV